MHRQPRPATRRGATVLTDGSTSLSPLMPDQPLIIVSNRGPAQFDRAPDGERIVRRGGGGLVTALSGLASHRRVLWVASAMSEEDVLVSEEAGGPVEVELDGINYDVEMVASDPEAYDLFYNCLLYTSPSPRD